MAMWVPSRTTREDTTKVGCFFGALMLLGALVYWLGQAVGWW